MKEVKKYEDTKITGDEAFLYYRKNSKYRKVKNTERQRHHRKIVVDFWKRVSNKLIENQGGVYVERFGYFCIAMVPNKFIPNPWYNDDIFINPHTKSRVYFPLFIPNKENYTLRGFVMDRNFSLKVKRGISKKLKKGFKYKNYYKELYMTFLDRYRKTRIG